MQKGKSESDKIARRAIQEKASAEERIKKIDGIIRCLYEDRVVGRITPERYDEMVAGYEEEWQNKRRN